MLPVVIRSTEEMLRLVPDELRQASLALGARKWRTTVTVVLPAAISGITSGALLAIARAAGETAPLIVVGGRHLHGELEPLRGREHGAAGADLPQRHASRSRPRRSAPGARR